MISACVSQFFEPRMSGIDPDGRPIYTTNYSNLIVQRIFEANKEKLFGAVVDKLDLNAIATAIAVQVSADLVMDPPSDRWSTRSEAQKIAASFRKEIRDIVIDKLAEAEAARMRAALSEE